LDIAALRSRRNKLISQICKVKHPRAKRGSHRKSPRRQPRRIRSKAGKKGELAGRVGWALEKTTKGDNIDMHILLTALFTTDS